MNWQFNLFLTIVLIGVMGCSNASNYKLGTSQNPIKFLFTPSVESSTLIKNSFILIKFLEKETGLKFTATVPTNYISVVESFGTHRADVAILNSFGYLLANSKYGALAKAIVIRDDQSFYSGQIITHVNSNIKTIKDIHGKKFAYADPSSLSGYLFPKQLLDFNGIVPGKIVFGMKHDIVVTMVYQRQVDAGATFYSPPNGNTIQDARFKVIKQFPDVEQKVKILQLTQNIPNDPIVFKKDFPKEMIEIIVDALILFTESDEGKKVLHDMYSIDGIVVTTDSEFDSLRSAIQKADIEIGDVLKK